MRFKIDSASLIVGSKFTVFALFYFVFEGNFPSTSRRRGFCVTSLGGLYLRGLIHAGLIFGILRYLKNQMEIAFVSNYVYSNEAITKTPTI